MLRSVAVLSMEGMSPFDLGVLDEVFGVSRPDEVSAIDFRVLPVGQRATERPLGMDVRPSGHLAFVDGADLVAVPGHPSAPEGSPRSGPHATGPRPRGVDPGPLPWGSRARRRGVARREGATTHWMHVAGLATTYPGSRSSRTCVTSSGTGS